MEDWSDRLLRLELPDEDKARVRVLLLEKQSSDRPLYFAGSDKQALGALKQLLQLHDEAGTTRFNAIYERCI